MKPMHDVLFELPKVMVKNSHNVLFLKNWVEVDQLLFRIVLA